VRLISRPSSSSELYTRGEALPVEWKYRPGIHPVDLDDHFGPMMASATTATLFGFMPRTEVDAKRLKARAGTTELINPCMQKRVGVASCRHPGRRRKERSRC
jgi:hypothetical protein